MKKMIFLFISFFSITSVNAQLIDVWDFGATQLDNTIYNNKLNVSNINAFYGSTPAGTLGINFPATFAASPLTWNGGTNDRLRTTNTNLTRFDANIASVTSYTGRLYCNANAAVSATTGLPTSRYLTIALTADDELNIITRGDTAGLLTFMNSTNPSSQTDTFVTTSTSGSVTEAKFVAKTTGNYYIYDSTSKASFYRIFRKDAVYTNVNGTIDTSSASGIPAGYSIVFTNTAGKSWTSTISGGNYNVNLPVGYNYTISLANANGYVIQNGTTLSTVGVITPNFTKNIVIAGISYYTVSGNISGLGTSISNLSSLSYIPNPASGTVFVPNPIINTANSTYTVQLEANIQYTIAAQGVNDFQIPTNTITIPAQATNADLVFSPKPTYPVTINTTGLSPTQLGNLQLTFTNLNEPGYSYNFTNLSSIALRNGTYKISFSGLDNFPVQLAPTSNLVINSAATSKSIVFKPVTVWSFEDKAINSTTTTFYKGMQLNGQVSTVPASGHLTAKTGAEILVPVEPGQKVLVNYYFTANFSIAGGATISTASNSTAIVESAQYVYTGSTAGFVSIAVGGAASLSSYFTEIKVLPNVVFTSTVTVGPGKNYSTINAALEAVSTMVRPNSERVTLLIDPGNYEEMLVINQPNITLKNASPIGNTNVVNAGINIDANAVRITSYYGHGYNYYSMGSNQKWNQDALNVNLQNGNFSNNNAGAGTTNGSYWNATVVISANGFEAEKIIFENSFNQYISQKESQDVVVPYTSGSPGARPTNFGNTSVQNKILVERAAAMAVTNNTDKVLLKECKIIGRQDTFFGGTGARVVLYRGSVLGAVDYIFGAMNAVFYKTDLVMNVSDQSSDSSYITAAQQSSGRGYLMYECTIKSTIPTTETASVYRAKPGFFGRPWQPNTSEVVFYNTTIETSNFPGSVGNSLISPIGWNNSLNGTSSGMYEYGTTELSGVNNIPNRATWATTLVNPVLNDATPITTFNFTKGNDGWDPIADIEATLSTTNPIRQSTFNVFAINNEFFINNVKSKTKVSVYTMNGGLAKSFSINGDHQFTISAGIWLLTLESNTGLQSIKLLSK